MDRALTEQLMARIPQCPTALEGRDIVVLSHQRWDSHFTPIHGTTLRLAQRNRVLFMDPPDSVALLLRDRSARAAFARTFNPFDRFGPQLGVYRVAPLFLPMQPYSRWIMRSIDWTYARMVRDGLRRMGMSKPLLWIYQFNTVGVAEALDPVATVYECFEETAEFARRERVRTHIREMDARLCRHADLVIVPNEQMRATRAALSREIHVMPWPVDADHYGEAMNPALPVPDDLKAITPPIVGFYGNLDSCRFDVPLVVGLARRRPEWSFVLIGPFWQGFDPAPLRAVPNIHCLGPRPLAALPAYVKGFDVSWIPYAINGFTRSITPLKLMEYLATGKPVVSSALPAAEGHADVLRVARSIDEFEVAIAAAMADPASNRETRLRVAREHDWAHYMLHKTEIAAAMLARRESAAPESKSSERV